MCKSRTFRVSGTVTICLNLTTVFKDNGKYSLEDLAYDELSSHDDIPLDMSRYIDSVDIDSIEEVSGDES